MHKSFILAVSHAAIDVNDVLTAVSLAPKYVRLFAMVVRSMVGTFAQLHPFGTKQYPARKKRKYYNDSGKNALVKLLRL